MRWRKKELVEIDGALAAAQAAGARADAGLAALDELERTRAPQRARVNRKIRQNGFGHELELVVKIPIAGAH